MIKNKKFRKILLNVMLTICLVYVPGVSELLSIFFYATVAPPFCFTTIERNFNACGDVTLISASDHYLKYKQKFPDKDHTLYRYNKTRDWRYFFMWRIFLTDANWRTPYLKGSQQGQL